MDTNLLKQQIMSYVKVTSFSQEDKEKILSKLPDSTSDQLESLKTIMMQQMVMDAFMDETEKLQVSNKLLDETDLEEMYQRVVKKIEDTQSSVLTEAELNQIRNSLQGISQSVSASAPTIPNPVSPSPAVSEATVSDSPVPPKV